jgi:hypothetical protein
MTLGTGDAFVLSVKRELCLVVVEQLRLPVIIAMAFQAEGGFGTELFVVHLPVAFQAGSCETRKALYQLAFLVQIQVTGTAGLAGMGSFQFIPGKGMVEMDLAPAGVLMTASAVLSGVIFLIHVWGMDILVAVVAVDPDLTEFPPFILPVAIEAGDGQMGPVEGKG